MHVELFVSASETTTLEEDFTNGANLQLTYCVMDDQVEIAIQDDGGKNIIPPFYVEKNELITMLKHLELK